MYWSYRNWRNLQKFCSGLHLLHSHLAFSTLQWFTYPPLPPCIFHAEPQFGPIACSINIMDSPWNSFRPNIGQQRTLSFWIYRLSSHNCAQQLASKLLTSSIKIFPEWANLVSKRGWVSIRENGRDKNDKKIKVNF